MPSDYGQCRFRKLGTVGVRNLGIAGFRILGIAWISNEQSDLERLYLKQELSQTSTTPKRHRRRVSFENFGRGEEMQSRTKTKSRSRRTFPDLSPFDLWNPIDIANAHTLLAAMGHAHDSYDGLHQVTLAAVLARRLATTNKAGYFAHIVRHGFGQYGPADKDYETAKRIIREIHGWEQR
jgi:hypothetical protein